MPLTFSRVFHFIFKEWGGTVSDADKDEIFRELFLQKPPITVRTALAIHKDATLIQLSEMADNMAEVQGP